MGNREQQNEQQNEQNEQQNEPEYQRWVCSFKDKANADKLLLKKMKTVVFLPINHKQVILDLHEKSKNIFVYLMFCF